MIGGIFQKISVSTGLLPKNGTALVGRSRFYI